MDLVILESPNKVRDVERYARACGFQVTVVATVGHLMDLPPMSEGAAIDTGSFALDGQVPRDAAAAERVRRIKSAILAADEVIVATDPDREGEAIAAEVWGWIAPGRAWRATFQEITPAGVERGLRARRRSLAIEAVEAAHTRRVIDRLAGWHGTSLVFDKLRQHKGLSAGRLQSAALRLVVERHREHEGFVRLTSYGARVVLRGASGAEFVATLVDEDDTARSFATEAHARALAIPEYVEVLSVDARRKEQRPRPPFEASSWLQVASKSLGLSVKEATQGTQALFEAGHTTYPRTDTVRVADEAIAWAREEIERRHGPRYVPKSPWQHRDGVASSTQGAHEAIRPTIPHGSPADLKARQAGPWGEAYALIEARFFASQAVARVVEQTRIRLSGGEVRLLARGQVELFDGWRRLLSTEAVEEPDRAGSQSASDPDGAPAVELPSVASGERFAVVRTEVTTHVTKPKPLLTQASLVAELKRIGIGRPSTYQTVIPLLLSRGWVTEATPASRRDGAKASCRPWLVPTEAGQDLCTFLVEALPGLVDYQFTASMEQALDQIEQGAKRRIDVARIWWSRFERELAAAKTIAARSADRQDLGPCPRCAAAGRDGRLRLIHGVNRETRKPFEFAACDAGGAEADVCRHKAQVEHGQLLPPLPCPRCAAPLRAVNRKDGGRSWLCQEHGWFLAGRRWQLVLAPTCPTCRLPMTHRERRDPKGEFLWACFADRVFVDSDRFGTVKRHRPAGSS